MGVIDQHFNGSLGLISVGLRAYDKMPNDLKRSYAYKLSKRTGLKSGKIFQGVKAFSRNAGEVAGKLGTAGTILSVGAITYDLFDDGKLKPSSIVNGTLIGVGLIFPVTAPFILGYGVLDYTFDISDKIDNNFNSINTHIYD